jgi:ABC-type bacteriocin/lantibiotic exporter with double-glycine peptidase domain
MTSALWVIIWFIVSCSTLRAPRTVLDVPFRPQPPDHCGTACLEMVLRYHGVEVDFEQLRNEVHVPALGGTIPDLIADYAVNKGLQACVTRGDLTNLRDWLDERAPPIVLFGPFQTGQTNGHFVVVTGITDDTSGIRLHSGNKPDTWLDAGEFMKRWDAGRNTVILIRDLNKR